MARQVIDVAASAPVVRSAVDAFDALSDVEGLLAALQRKAPLTVERLSGSGALRVGDKWRVTADTSRLGQRKGVVEIAALDRPGRIAFSGKGSGFRTETELVIIPTDAAACRIDARSRLIADSMRARLAAPFIRLYRGRIERGFQKLLTRAARRIET
ncbi:MAG: hypothetical protein AAFP78_11830 [Pseudomonadota bacterium]